MAEADKTITDALASLDRWVSCHLLRLAHEAYSEQSRIEASEVANLVYMLRQQLIGMCPLWKDDAQALQNDYIASQM